MKSTGTAAKAISNLEDEEMKMRRGIVLLLATALAVVLAVVAQARPLARSAATINIGWVGDKSGPTAVNQLPSLHGLETAIRYVNTHGGINGSPINLIEKDDQYNPVMTLSLVKSLISDDHVPVIMGLAQSTAYASVVPVFDQTHTLGVSTLSAQPLTSQPFNPWLFAGSCSFADQVDVGIAYEMKHLGLKSLQGVNVGIAAIQVASGQQVIDEAKKVVENLGGNVVAEFLPPALVSADVQVQDMVAKNVKFVFEIHTTTGAITIMRAMDKYGLNVPVIADGPTTVPAVFTAAPYSIIKDTVGVNCFDPPYLAKTAKAKLITTLGKQYGIATTSDLGAPDFAGGFANGMLLAQALKNAKGNYSSAGIKKGYEMIKNFDPTGGLSPLLSYGPKCHLAIPNPRIYRYNFNTSQFRPVGSWKFWASADTKPYAPPGTCGVPRGAKK